ncbi:MAG: arsenate reductase ArsC [Bacteroidetes bacterium]|nr:arsenate reductase ArsC [Bacteroidota bacterium]MBS1940422.1 arsenate reductase ArsC [Bacteroidota bacterium]
MEPRILVLCTGNSCRSQMAEGYLRHFANGRFEVCSAGVEAHGLNPRTVAVMLEDGVDISSHTSKTLEVFEGQRFDLVLTVCDNARERCPWFPAGTKQLHHDFPDPAQVQGSEADVMEAFRRVQDLIKAYCRELANEQQRRSAGDSVRGTPG